jgi:xylulokinase
LDEYDVPLTPFIVWTDARGGVVPQSFQEFAATADFAAHIGYRGLSVQSAPVKWRWFQEKLPLIWQRARRVMTLSDYLTFELTGEYAGDASTAAFLGDFDLAAKTWWLDALRVYGLRTEQLSAPLRPGSACGRTAERAASLLDLPKGIPFAVGALDHHAAAIGSGLGTLADASISTGTVLAALVLVDRPVVAEACFHGLHVDGQRLWRLAFDQNGAGQLEDFQRARAPEKTIEQLLAQAAQAPVGAAWIQQRDSDEFAVRAILERVAAKHHELLSYVTSGREGSFGKVSRVVATGGGARSPLWLQITADILNLPIATPKCVERACLGAACFAAAAAGVYPTLHDASAAMIRPDRVYEPDAAAVQRYAEARHSVA